METIEIRVTPTRKMFFNEETFFGIYACDVNEDDKKQVELNGFGNISFKGVTSELEFGQEYVVKLTKDEKSKYKGSYNLESIKQERPQTTEEQKRYFEAILTKNQVDAIYEVYNNGEDVVELITSGNFDYANIRGFGDKTFAMLREKVDKTLDSSEILAFISKYGIKYGAVSKLLKEYGSPKIVIEKIESNPYVLSSVKGVGFLTCDEIAKAMGHSMTSHNRIKSCIIYVLSQETNNGHSWMEYKKLLNSALTLLQIDKSYIVDVLNNGIKGVMNVNERYTRDIIYEAEEYIATRMIQMNSDKKKVFTDEELGNFLDAYCEKNNVELEENQRQFFYDWNENRLTILVGGGGMGKTWLTKILIELIKTKKLTTALLAPTGK